MTERTAPEAIEREDWLQRRSAGWRDLAGRWFTGATIFLTVTGLSIYLLPFSTFNQHAVIVHTLAGLVFLVPGAIYLVRHVRAYWHFPATHVKFTGWVSGLMLIACVVSGLVLTGQSAFGRGIEYVWRTVHIVGTFGLVLFLGAHLATVWARARSAAQSRNDGELIRVAHGHARLVWGSATLLVLATMGLTLAVPGVEWNNEFPAGYDQTPYEGAGPFSPSLANTVSGGALDARTLAGSASCGTSGCHEEIYAEWLPSAHRYASMDAAFQAVQGVMAKQNGPESTRYCGGCHDPISLFSGTKNIGVENLTNLAGYQEGISCVACHGIQETDVAGNANYVMAQPNRYVWELREGKVAKFLSDFLIRAYPDHHVQSLSRRMFKTPEFCAACHKQFIDEEVNKVGWVQLQNQFDNWRASRWHDAERPERTVECRECHMPLVADSLDPASGDGADANRSLRDRKHRSHRFLGANQFIPALMELEGAEKHIALTEQWLRGEIEIPEISEKWSKGPAVPIELEVPASASPGEAFDVRVRVVNNKVGHDFPTGPLDIIQAWIEVEVTDADGRSIFHTGKRDANHFVEQGAFMFKAEPVDRYGNLIDRHNLWEMVGVRFKRSLFPGSEEVATFSVDCSGARPHEGGELDEEHAIPVPTELKGPLKVVAKLNYRKVDQYLLNFMFGEDAGITSPVTTLSTAEAQVALATQ
ncbi:MAG: hypothetical protein GY711_18770 [bacterium]|nr:hypothetical protein [bacterium]